MSKNKADEKLENFIVEKPVPNEKKTEQVMRVETFLHIVGTRDINKLGLITYAKKFSTEVDLTFSEWKEFFTKY